MEVNFLAEIHPKVVHFPVALLATYSILEIVGIIFKKEFLTKSALLILCLGVVTALLAVFTGYEAATTAQDLTDNSSALLDNHQTFATYLLWSSAIVCGLRIYAVIKKKFSGLSKYFFLIAAILILFLVFNTGTYGGDLVKKYGLGTDIIKDGKSR